MRNAWFLCACLLTLAACQPIRAPRPNVLFIAIDDLKPILGAYGDSLVQTPHIDALAAESMVFLNSHCQQALCGPSRSSLLTGLYPDQIQVWGFDRKIRAVDFPVTTLPQYFRENGYYTVGISKIFDYRNVDKRRDSLSWSEPAFPATANALDAYYPDTLGPVAGYFYQSPLVKALRDSIAQSPSPPSPLARALHQRIKPATESLDLPDHAYKDGVFAQRAMEDLTRLSQQKQPFFLALGFERPHLPYTAPKKYWDLYQRDRLPLAPFQQHAAEDSAYTYTSSGSIKSYTDREGRFIYRKLARGERLDTAEQRELLHGYLAAVSYIDAQVGKVLHRLDSLGLRENTVIVLWGDHGYHLYDHGMWGKSSNFEQATRSPLMISGQGLIKGITPIAVSFVDIFPTLCEMSGLPVPPHLPGHSLRGLMQGRDPLPPGYAVSQFPREEKMGYAIRDARYRYVEWYAEGRHVNPAFSPDTLIWGQLFDYQTDPYETRNLIADPEYATVRAELAAELARFYQQQLFDWQAPE